MAILIIVSHSKKVTEDVAEIAEQMNNKQSKLIPISGIEDERIGTNSLKNRLFVNSWGGYFF
ncbi:hypothetical protein O163_05440 [Caldanaerobacter subterraneus subsp. yonseiensis KB-1]|uniref:PTS EIIA type-4 domain-containing protein n=1 Tax=Caldanaerobacter subterraneus subsp. yonseiensis KB-1 TaxID=1388761 RepID=U5CWN4_CALSX|nr:hypothetical protein [Caldanaerobacter subterraneus]ERM92452.1 hypothetical protein O163_05440 [Caldanaerobacter subterraneus subsp. yonseiensis KB-1]